MVHAIKGLLLVKYFHCQHETGSWSECILASGVTVQCANCHWNGNPPTPAAHPAALTGLVSSTSSFDRTRGGDLGEQVSHVEIYNAEKSRRLNQLHRV